MWQRMWQQQLYIMAFNGGAAHAASNGVMWPQRPAAAMAMYIKAAYRGGNVTAARLIGLGVFDKPQSSNRESVAIQRNNVNGCVQCGVSVAESNDVSWLQCGVLMCGAWPHYWLSAAYQ